MTIYESTLSTGRPHYLGGGQWVLQNLNDITVIFGKNGSGKSQLLRSLKDANRRGIHYVSPERGGELTHEAGLVAEELSGENRGNRRSANFSPSFRQEAITRYQAMLIKLGQVAGDTGTSPLLLKDVLKSLHELLPDFVFEHGDNPSLIIKRISDDRAINVQQLSSGEAGLLALAIDIVTICKMWELEDRRPRILLLDEPDTHLHPDLQQQLGKFLVSLVDSDKLQIVVATHSTTMLSALGFHGGSRTSIIYLINSQEQQPATPLSDHLTELATCLGGHALMGPLFAAPLLLVEGDDDVQIWTQVPRYHRVRLAVIPCSGKDEVKKYQKLLEKLFASLRDDSSSLGFALLDGDQNVPTDPQNPQKFVKYLGLGCRESENLYLSDEVLSSMGLTWEQAQQRIEQRASEFGQKEAQLRAILGSDRQDADYKGVMLQLVEILDEKRVSWTLRVAKAIGGVKPTGQLAAFLGPSLMEVIWPTPAEAVPGQAVGTAAAV